MWRSRRPAELIGFRFFSNTIVKTQLADGVSNGTLFWCSRVVFGSSRSVDPNEWCVQNGAVLVNSSGIIEKCFPGLSRDDARSMTASFGGRGPAKFVDLTKNHTPSSTTLGYNGTVCLSPGLIDVHTHISSLGRNWEGYTTATASAAAGGITTIIGMPLNSLPPTVSVNEVEQELELATSKSVNMHVDVGLWGGVLPETVEKKQQLLDLIGHPNVLGLKAFLSPLPEGAGYQAISPRHLVELAKLCGTFNKPILVHSEIYTVEEQQQVLEQVYLDDGSLDDSHYAHVASRPAKWEQDAVKVVIEASQYCDMHVVHLSDGVGCLPLIQEARKRNLLNQDAISQHRRLTVETCPHYLLFDTDQISSSTAVNGTTRAADDRRVKCFPPIREPFQRRRLWQGLLDGDIQMIASDHSPCEPHMRHDVPSMKAAWGGLTGLQYQLPATWTAAQNFVMNELNDDSVNEESSSSMSQISTNVTEKEMADWWSSWPSQLAGLDTDRGSIEPGKRADFVLWDTSYVGPPDGYVQEYHKWKGDSVYSSMSLNGRVLGTWLQGKQIYDGIEDKMLLTNEGTYVGRN